VSAIAIRDVTERDAPQVAEVVRSGVATLRETYRPRPGAALPALPPRARLVAVRDGRVVGTVEHFREGDRVHLVGLFVDERSRRCGVARALIAELLGRARALGARRLSLYTIRESGNVAVFERLGFQVVEEHDDLYMASDRHAGLHEAYMERGT